MYPRTSQDLTLFTYFNERGLLAFTYVLMYEIEVWKLANSFEKPQQKMYYMPLHTTSLQFPQLFEDFAVKMFKAIKCKNVSASEDRWKIWGWLRFVPTNFWICKIVDKILGFLGDSKPKLSLHWLENFVVPLVEMEPRIYILDIDKFPCFDSTFWVSKILERHIGMKIHAFWFYCLILNFEYQKVYRLQWLMINLLSAKQMIVSLNPSSTFFLIRYIGLSKEYKN